MSQPDDQKPIELHMFSPWETDEVVEVLVATAHYHRTAARLDLGHSVNFGRSWIGTSECKFGLVSLPYLDGPALEVLNESRNVNFYWLIPVSFAEVEFKKQNGLAALEERFDRTVFDYLNPERKSIV